ncbi:glycohydrolase toxin TNT-related protein [Alistipes sp.]|uniref:glycohydrolase toxin TNT-related protein n=1 Tax=Alistipes sp. TaxID=1872444 RepID=UPI00345B2897
MKVPSQNNSGRGFHQDRFHVQSGRVAPAYNLPGGGTQYIAPVKVDVLLKRGFIIEY